MITEEDNHFLRGSHRLRLSFSECLKRRKSYNDEEKFFHKVSFPVTKQVECQGSSWIFNDLGAGSVWDAEEALKL